MKTRCTNPRSKSFSDYGGKGVRVCDRWAASFADFLVDMGERPVGKTIDRWPDKSGNYEPGNCRWASRIEQQRNTTANVNITFNGETLTQAEWALRQGVKQATLSYRLRKGWTVLDALSLESHSAEKQSRPQRAPTGRFASKMGDEVELP